MKSDSGTVHKRLEEQKIVDRIRTERLAFNIVNKLFNNFEVIIVDHKDTDKDNRDLLCRVLRRLADLKVGGTMTHKKYYSTRERDGYTLIKLHNN